MKNEKTLGMVQIALLGAIIVLMSVIPFLGYIPLGVIRATIIHVPVIIGSIVLGPKKGAILGALFGITSLVNNTLNPTITSFVFTPFFEAGGIGGNPLSLVICFVPRILVGVVPYYVYHGLRRLFQKKKGTDALSICIAGICGSMTNTLLVMNMIYLFFGKAYAASKFIKQLTETGIASDVAQQAVTAVSSSLASGVQVLTANGIASEQATSLLQNMNLSASGIYNAFIIPVVGVNGIVEAVVAAVLTAAIVTPLLKIKHNNP